ncbi:hypothetical protein F5Y15DRAFT_403400 [Xylariaceae sp. FL0016]|nr:hypothetical protein F5Y15DRAFT_403400 [Xylariaceae sp. FL0016]
MFSATYDKFTTAIVQVQLRDPDSFGMYTFNDHAAYGALEVVQNLLLDFEEAAARGWREEWLVCEAMVMFLSNDAGNMMICVS